MSRTWFLPPDFTFLPEGQIALGMVIPEPQRPTMTLASLSEHPNIVLPKATTMLEKGRTFMTEKSRSFGHELFVKFLGVASADSTTSFSWYKNKSFSAVDHEVQTFSGPFTPETLEAIVDLERVKRHIDSGRFGKRYVYIVSGLRIAQQAFTVTDGKGKTTASSLGGSGSIPAGALPLELGGNISGSRDNKKESSYETAPGIIFAYRLHVIRPKHSGTEGELFSDRTAFFSGEAEQEESKEMEAIEVNGAILRQDLDVKIDGYSESERKGDNECYIVFNPESTG